MWVKVNSKTQKGLRDWGERAKLTKQEKHECLSTSLTGMRDHLSQKRPHIHRRILGFII